MRTRGNRLGKGHFFRKSLILVLLITSLPTALIGTAIYYFGITQIEDEVNRAHQAQVRQAVHTMDNYFTQLEATTSQWAFNPIFDDQLKTLPFSYLFEKTQDLYKSLTVMRGSNPLIDRVYLYLYEPSLMISNEDGIQSLQEGQDRASYQRLMQSNKPIFWTTELPDPRSDASKITLVHKLPRWTGQPLGAMIVHLDLAKMNRMLNELNVEEQTVSFLLNENGKPISNVRGSLLPELEDPLTSQIRGRAKELDSFVYKHKDEEYSVSYSKFTRSGAAWTYITLVPLNQLTKPVAILARLIMAISLFGLVMAVVLSWLASKRMYRPIERLVQAVRSSSSESVAVQHEESDELEYLQKRWQHMTTETHQLEQRLEQQLPYLREGFLLQLVQGHLYSLSESSIRERMEQFGWDLHERGFSVLLIQLLGLVDSGKFQEGDEQLVTFSAANIIGELAGAAGEMDSNVLNFQDITVGVLFSYPSNWTPEETKGRLFRLADQIQSALEALLKLHVTMVLGKMTTSVKSIPQTFEEARHSLSYRDVHLSSQLIDMDQVGAGGQDKVSYPFDIEAGILHAIRIENEQEAIERLEGFIQELQELSGKEYLVQQGMMQLLGSIQHVLLKAGFHLSSHHEGANLYEQLFLLREPHAMVKWFHQKVLKPYWTAMSGMKDAQDLQLRQTVDEVVRTLQERYTQSDISLESCADLHQIHPYALSKAFKQVTGVNFIDYLTELRLDHSRRLLVGTDIKINDVAVQVGYQPSYFNRIFKKHEGVTPSQYRQQIRSHSG